MVPHVLCTAVEYDIPVVWVVWNNFAWAAIRDLQYAYFDGREIGTAFYHGPNRKPYNPDFAAWARAAGVAAFTVTRSQDFAGVLAQAVALDKPALIDVHVDADIRPPSTGAWELPPMAPKEPVFGGPWLYQRPDRKPDTPDFAAGARGAGVASFTGTRSQDFAVVLAQAVARDKPALIDVHVDADIRPPSTGAWELPPMAPKEPVFGGPWQP